MIQREQLVAALNRLDPRDREVLDLSLHRRVPDESLARVYAIEEPEVARRRAGAIERLSADLDVQRGQDLGHMLQALLDPETWRGVTDMEGPPPSADGAGEEEASEVQAEGPEAAPERAEVAPESAVAAPEAAVASALEEPDSREGPVLEMLSDSPRRDRSEERGRGRRRVSAVIAAAATVLVPAGGIVAAATLNDEAGDAGGSAVSQTRSFVPEEKGPLAQPFPSDPVAPPGYSVARITRRTVLYERPGGNVKLRIPARTEWDSTRVLGVVRQSGAWIAVQVPELPNGEVGWIRAGGAQVGTVPFSLHADLSKRRLTVRKDGRTVRRMRIAVGAPGHSTPTGRFSITDKLRVSDPSSPYGCCVLALTGHQTRLPAGWPGGDRLAVHATRDASSIGNAVSLGCMRTHTASARWLIRTIPLGAPIFVRT